jgi:hypothetical protein
LARGALAFLAGLQLHERGIVQQLGQCHAFAPHPAPSGRIEIEHVMVMDIGVWQQICAQLSISGQGQ